MSHIFFLANYMFALILIIVWHVIRIYNLNQTHVFYIILEGARASTGLCVDVGSGVMI